jgi:hypothetical protein
MNNGTITELKPINWLGAIPLLKNSGIARWLV